MTGTLFVLPVPLADADPRDVLLPPLLTIAREARYLLAENARSARAFLKAAGHPGPIQQVRIIEIGHQPQVSQALEWLAPLRSGQSDAALVSECGCPGIADPGATVVAFAHEARYLLAENARSARAFLKAAGHPGPIQQVRIIEIGHQPQVSQALEWLAPLRSGQSDAALVSECGCPGIADPGATVVACAH